MTGFHALPPEVATEFAKLSRNATLPMDADQGKTFFDALPVASKGTETKWNFIRLDGTKNAMLQALITDQGIPRITCHLCDGLADLTPENLALLDPVFDEAVVRVIDVLGKPTKKKRGEFPQCDWLLPEGSAVTVSRTYFVSIELHSPKTYELENIEF